MDPSRDQGGNSTAAVFINDSLFSRNPSIGLGIHFGPVSFDPVDILECEYELHHGGQQRSEHREAVVLQVVRHVPHRHHAHDAQGPSGGGRQHARAPVQQHVVVCAQVQVRVHEFRLKPNSVSPLLCKRVKPKG